MEKIRLNSGKEFELIVCGINVNDEVMSLQFLPGDNTLDSLNDIFSDDRETRKITLASDSGEDISIYSGFIQLESMKMQNDYEISDINGEKSTIKLITVVLKKDDEILTRIINLETQVTDTQMALCEIYEEMGAL